MVASLLSPLERGRTAKARRSSKTTILATVGSGVGAALSAFGLLGYVASGLQPAPHGSSVLLFVPVDPIQNTVCVVVGFALSYACAWLSRRGSPGGQPG